MLFGIMIRIKTIGKQIYMIILNFSANVGEKHRDGLFSKLNGLIL